MPSFASARRTLPPNKPSRGGIGTTGRRMPHTRRTNPMPTQLAEHIQNTTLCDTHEHLRKESEFVERGPDILQSLFENYVTTDLGVAGAPGAAVAALLDGKNPDIRARFNGIRPAWEAVRHTGYGEAV